jgi:thioredoxin reductase
VPGVETIYGANAHVCPDCDGYDSRGKKVVVMGNGRRAVGMALNLTTWTRDIIICTNGRPAEIDEPEYWEKLDALNIPVISEPIVRVCEEGSRIRCLQFESGMELDADKVFFAIAQYPADDLGAQLGCERDDEGHIAVDAHGHTSVRNVYAAGDVIPGPQLAVVAAAHGAAAALAMHKSLVPPERKLLPREATTVL